MPLLLSLSCPCKPVCPARCSVFPSYSFLSICHPQSFPRGELKVIVRIAAFLVLSRPQTPSLTLLKAEAQRIHSLTSHSHILFLAFMPPSLFCWGLEECVLGGGGGRPPNLSWGSRPIPALLAQQDGWMGLTKA